jgi:hypothetical protein
VQDEVAVEGGHYGLEEGAQGGGAGEAFAGRLQENGVWGIKLQDGFQLFGAKALHPGCADFRNAAMVEACGLAVAVGGKLGAPMVAQARNAMAARPEQQNSRDLTEGIEEACVAAPIN